jgi:hypothetical protein
MSPKADFGGEDPGSGDENADDGGESDGEGDLFRESYEQCSGGRPTAAPTAPDKPDNPSETPATGGSITPKPMGEDPKSNVPPSIST